MWPLDPQLRLWRDIRFLPQNNPGQYAWRALRKFHNVADTTSLICRKRNIPVRHKKNVQKQMEQLRSCLTQGREYFDAFEVVSLATKPLHFYYCCMSFALAEILWKGDGNYSLDKLRSEHRHHGLQAKFDPMPTGNLIEAASSLRARPMITDAGRHGSLQVWHRLARHSPIVGKQKRHLAHGSETSPKVIFLAADRRMKILPARGISLLDCLQRIPGMGQHLRDLGANTVLVRAIVSKEIREQSQNNTEIACSIVVQPGDDQRLEEFKGNILFDANAVDQIDTSEYLSGFNVYWRYRAEVNPVYCSLPEGFSEKIDVVHFLDDMDCLNEFGFIYVGLYIIGMFSRYYPDIWTRENERHSQLSIAIDQFLDVARERLPILLLSELNEAMYVFDQ